MSGAAQWGPGPAMRDPDLFHVRRARKPHPCRLARFAVPARGWDHGAVPPDHSPTIQPGETYVEYMGEAPAFQAGDRYCLGCAGAAGLVVPGGRRS